MTFSYRALSEASTADIETGEDCQNAQNNLSRPAITSVAARVPTAADVSDTEMEYRELCPHSPHSDDNNTAVTVLTAPNPLCVKYSSDSGRSSLRETRSPFMQRVPFRSFQHVPSASLDETGNYSQDEEVANVSKNGQNRRPVHSNSFNVRPSKPDISYIRATANQRVRPDMSSGFIAEAPVGFRSGESHQRRNSPVSNTSDYSSNSPTPEIVTYFTSSNPVPRSHLVSGRYGSNSFLTNDNHDDYNLYGGSSQALHYGSLAEVSF